MPDRIIYFWAKDEDLAVASPERNAATAVGHTAFFLFNVMNFSAILLVQSFVFRRLRANYLAQLALGAVIFQLASCYYSILRDNINQEFNADLVHPGIATGLIATTFLNFGCLHLFLMNKCRDSFEICGFKLGYIRTGQIFWVVVAIIVFAGGFYKAQNVGENESFATIFEGYIGVAMIYQTIAVASCAHAYRNQKIDQDIIPREAASRLLTLAVVLKVLIIVSLMTGIPIIKFSASGLNFTVCAMVFALVGEMDFMQEGEP